MNLDEAICGLSDYEDEPSGEVGYSNSSGTMVEIKEESKFDHLELRNVAPNFSILS
jgi:hypothetical protein